MLVQVKKKRERSLPVRPPSVEKTSRLGSRDPVAAGSSTGGMVARTATWSRGRFLGWATKPRLSRDFVGAKWWVVIGGGYINFTGFAVVHQKTIGLLGWTTKPRPKTGHGYQAKTGLTGLENRSDRFGVAGRRKLRGGGHASGSQGLRRGYAKWGAGHPSDGATKTNSQSALGGRVS
jgi:hypothetical protein